MIDNKNNIDDNDAYYEEISRDYDLCLEYLLTHPAKPELED